MDRCYKFLIIAIAYVGINIFTTEVYADYEGMGNELSNNNQIISITNEEYMLLSKLVAGEARGESYEGQVAVAAVVINRLEDPRFPKSIEDVIFQKNAFSVVRNGNIVTEATETAYKAVDAALYGHDPTDDAIYFWNPRISTCKWIETLNPYMRIGNHVFAK